MALEQSAAERKALELAESSRERNWRKPSFLRDLFLGRFRPELVDLEQQPPERPEFRRFMERFELFLRTEVDSALIDATGEYPAAVILGLTKLGAFGMKIPTEYGGLGLNQWEYGRVMALLGSVDGNLTALLSAHQSIGVPQPVKIFGTEDQKRRFLPRCAAGAISGFAAAPGHNKAVLSWNDPTTTDANFYQVVIYSNAWGTYPTYPAPAPSYPAATGTPVWNGAGNGHTVAYATNSTERNIHYYGAFASDWALNYGPPDSGGQDRCTNYWLGDVARPDNTWNPDGYVHDPDIVKLSGIYGSAPTGDFQKCDVGPTDDHSRIGIPEPDNSVSFEDLMIFAMNYDVVAAKVVPFLGEPGVGDLALALVENGRSNDGVVELALRLEGNLGDVKGLTAELEFEGLEFLSARLSDEMSVRVADVFFWSNATSRSVQVDAAVLGTDVTIGGSGDVVLFTFQVLDETYSVDFTSAQLRGAANEDLTAELEGLSSEGVPVAFKLVQNSPNPFNPVTKVAYHVPSESRVTIRVFDVTGRLVTTLVDGVVEPGRHAAIWNGTNDAGESVGSGVYFCTMETPDYSGSHKMMLLK